MISTLSQREKQVLHLISHEHNSKEIASQLFISEHTVISHRKNLLIKMEAKNTAGLIRRGFEYGILRLQYQVAILFFLVTISAPAWMAAQCNSDDYTALRALYLATDSDELDGISSWEYMRDNPVPPVGCDLSLLDGVTLNGAGRVDELDFPFEAQASFPSEFSLLSELRECDLGDYYFNDAFPATLLQLTNLELLSWNAELTGTIPSGIINLTKLEVLILNDGELMSPLPDLSSLPLKHLDLSRNEFDEELPSWLWNITTLEVLSLFNCNFHGGIPDQIENLTNLKELKLSSNELSGTINSKLGLLTDLEELFLSSNEFYGILPVELGSLSNLTSLYIGYNDLSGGIPKEWADLSSLTYLSLAGNQLSGCFHPDLAAFCGVVVIPTINGSIGNNFNASWDDFCSIQSGECNCDVGDWNGLRAIYNELDGDNWNTAISANWDTVKNNVTMPVGFDKSTLTGVGINTEGCVDSLRIRNKNLSGALPEEIIEIYALRTLNFSKNSILGNIPDTLGDLPYLEDLRLHENQLTGSIYSDGFRGLKILSLDDNLFSGDISNNISQLRQLEQLRAANNSLSGTLPPGLGELTELHTLKLENSGLSGCFLPSLKSLCPQLTDVTIDVGNSLDDTWANYCANNSGACADCNNNYVEWVGRYNSDDWTKDYNWSTYCVPTIMDTVLIDNNAEVLIPKEATAYAAVLGVERDNILMVDDESTLHVDSGPTFCLSNNGEIIIEGAVLLSNGPQFSLVNNGVVNIYFGGNLTIKDGGGIGISNTSVIDNGGEILIRDMHKNLSANQIGFLNSGDTALFLNDWKLEIHNVPDIGFYNFTDAMLVNDGIVSEIVIDSIYNAGGLIQAAFINLGDVENDGDIDISNYAQYGLHNYGTFFNEDNINVTTVPDEGVGVYNEALFTNHDRINITQSDLSPVEDHVGIRNSGIFLNHDRITLSSVDDNLVSIINEHIFYNTEDSTGAGSPHIFIDGGNIGIENQSAFENTKNVTIENCDLGYLNFGFGGIAPFQDDKEGQTALKSFLNPASFNNYSTGNLYIDSCDIGLINGGGMVNEGEILMRGNVEAIQNGLIDDESVALKGSIEKSVSGNSDAVLLNNSDIEIIGGDKGVVNLCDFINEGEMMLSNVKFTGIENLDSFYNGISANIEIDHGGYNFIENPDSLVKSIYAVAFQNGDFFTRTNALDLEGRLHNQGEISIQDWDATGMTNSSLVINENEININNCEGGIVNGGYFWNASGGEISVFEIIGYRALGISNVPLPYTARSASMEWKNEGHISISDVRVTKSESGSVENTNGLGMLNNLPFHNKAQGYLGISECEAGLYNYNVIINDSLTRGISIHNTINDSMTFALLNDELSRIENYGYMFFTNADYDGMSNKGVFNNNRSANVSVSGIAGRSWIQRDGGYLFNEMGSIFEIEYLPSSGAPLEVETGGLLDGYSEISIVEKE